MLVDIHLDALVVGDDAAANPAAFRRWVPDFSRLAKLQSPEPAPFADNLASIKAGVHLLWRLPPAFHRHREHEDGLPLIPNRWLVVRCWGESMSRCRAWVVESDHLSDGTSYVDHRGGKLVPKRLGRATEFTSQWTEPAGGQPFLTAVGPNGPLGLAYQPQADNVLSFVDEAVCSDIPNGGAVRYMVAGWHSRPEDDPLHDATDVDSLRAALEIWSWAMDGAFPEPSGAHRPWRSLYVASVKDVMWNRRCTAAQANPAGITVGAGPTAVDAMAATLFDDLFRGGEGITFMTALRGQMHAADRPDGPYDLVESMHEAQFGSLFGSVRWEAHPREGEEEETLPPAVAARLQKLAKLHAEIDLTRRKLRSDQRDLHDLCWLVQYEPANSSVSASDMESLKDAVRANLGAIGRLEEEAESLRVWIEDALIPTSMELRPVQVPRFRYPLEPAVVVRRADGCWDDDEEEKPTSCRAATSSIPPTLDDLKSLAPRQWQPPWRPLFAEWTVEWRPLPFGKSWSFDGFDYAWSGDGPTGVSRTFGGRSPLVPGLRTMVRKALKNAHLDEMADRLGGDFLSASLHGFNQQLANRDPRPNLLCGDEKLTGRWQSAPLLTSNAELGIRGGQFRITRLQMVDAFGQTATLIDQGQAPRISALAAPRHPVTPEPGSEALIEAAPRLPQAARLDFDLGGPNGENVVVCWLQHNHTERSIAVFDPDGSGRAIYWLGTNEALHERPFPGRRPAAAANGLTQWLDWLNNKNNFDILLKVLDQSYWGIHPEAESGEGLASMLVGRPVALVRARLGISLAERAVPKAGYARKRRYEAVDYPTLTVRLGNALDQGDGLLGVFGDTGFAPVTENKRPVDLQVAVSGPDTPLAKELLLLIEPRATVHAYCGVLPVKEVRLPRDQIDRALSALEVPLHVGPVLCQWWPGPRGSGEGIPIPHSPAAAASWQWWEQTDTDWQAYPLAATAHRPPFLPEPQKLRDGLLVLKGKGVKAASRAAALPAKYSAPQGTPRRPAPSPDSIYPLPSLRAAVVRDGVNLFTGDLLLRIPLVEVRAGTLRYAIEVLYNSRGYSLGAQATDNVLGGRGWKLLDYPKIVEDGGKAFLLDGLAAHRLVAGPDPGIFVPESAPFAWSARRDGPQWVAVDHGGATYRFDPIRNGAHTLFQIATISEKPGGGAGLRFVYDGVRLQRITDDQGRVTEFVYDSYSGRLERAGTTKLTYGREGVDGVGGYAFGYDWARDLSKVCSPDGTIRCYTYQRSSFRHGHWHGLTGGSVPVDKADEAMDGLLLAVRVETREAKDARVSVRSFVYSYWNWCWDEAQVYPHWNAAQEYEGEVWAEIDARSPQHPYGHTTYLFHTGQPAEALVGYRGPADQAAAPALVGRVYERADFERMRTTTLRLGPQVPDRGTTLVPLDLPPDALVTRINCGFVLGEQGHATVTLEGAGRQIASTWNRLQGGSGWLDFPVRVVVSEAADTIRVETGWGLVIKVLDVTYVVPPFSRDRLQPVKVRCLRQELHGSKIGYSWSEGVPLTDDSLVRRMRTVFTTYSLASFGAATVVTATESPSGTAGKAV